MNKLNHGQIKKLQMFGWYYPSLFFVLREMKKAEKIWQSYIVYKRTQSGAQHPECDQNKVVWNTKGPKILPSIVVVVQSLSHVWLFATPWTAARLSLRVCSNACPLSVWCHPIMSPSVASFNCPQSFTISGSFAVSRLFTSDGQSIGASVSASVLSMNIQSLFPSGLTGLISLLPRDSQQASPAPQFNKCISPSVLSFLYGPTLTLLHNFWTNHSFDYMDICWQSNVCVF